MSGIDMFCVAEDQHRVVLLVDLLQRAGQRVVLRPEPVPVPTDPCLVACTRRALAEPWIAGLFERGGDVVAVRLDRTPLPGPCARVIDMQNWPARSADRKVAALVGWLVQHGPGANPVAVAGAAGAAGSVAGDPHGASRRRRSGSDGVRALLVLAALVIGGALLWLSAPEPGSRDAEASAQGATADPTGVAGIDPTGIDPTAIDPGGADGPMGANEPLGGAVPDGADAAPRAPVDDPGGAADAAPQGASVGIADGSTSAPVRDPPIREDAPRAASPGPAPGRAAIPASVPGAAEALAVAPLPPAPSDGLAHLCSARSVEAARVWAAALSWRERRRLPEEPCVRRLLERPGFEVLKDLLEVS